MSDSDKSLQEFQNVSECILYIFLFQYISGIWRCFLSCSWVPCFVCSGSSQWSVRKAGVDLTDHPWVMMMRGLLLLKPQEVRVCSCRGSSLQVSSPSKNSLKTELLTYGSFTVRTPLCSTAPWKSNSREIISLFFMITLHIRTCWGTGCIYFKVNYYK